MIWRRSHLSIQLNIQFHRKGMCSAERNIMFLISKYSGYGIIAHRRWTLVVVISNTNRICAARPKVFAHKQYVCDWASMCHTNRLSKQWTIERLHSNRYTFSFSFFFCVFHMRTCMCRNTKQVKTINRSKTSICSCKCCTRLYIYRFQRNNRANIGKTKIYSGERLLNIRTHTKLCTEHQRTNENLRIFEC